MVSPTPVIAKMEPKSKSQPPPPPPPPPPPASSNLRQSTVIAPPTSQPPPPPPSLPNRNPQPRFVPISSLEDVQVRMSTGVQPHLDPYFEP